MPGRKQAPDPQRPTELAERLHSAAIHLLRRLRVQDSSSGLTAPQLSALSVVVFGGPITMTDLAAAEQVRPPTISRLARALEDDGLVERTSDPDDRRVQLLCATPRGRRLLREGRRRRVRMLAADLGRLSTADRKLLERAVSLLEGIALPRQHPSQGR